MEYKITLKNQLRSLRFLIIGTIGFTGVVAFFYNNEGAGFFDDTFQYFIIFYIVLLIPTLFLHIEYFLVNRNDIVVIDVARQTISIRGKEKLNFKDVSKIISVMSPVLYRNDVIKFLPTDNYNYSIIKMKSGEHFVFTSLMSDNVEDVMKSVVGVQIERRMKLLASTLFVTSVLRA